MTDRRTKRCSELLRKLLADVQGAPVPNEDINTELYGIWYEHVQKDALNCLSFLDENFPEEKVDFTRALGTIFK